MEFEALGTKSFDWKINFSGDVALLKLFDSNPLPPLKLYISLSLLHLSRCLLFVIFHSDPFYAGLIYVKHHF